MEVVLVKDPASVQGAYEKIKDAFAEVGTAEKHNTFRCESGLNAKFYKTSESSPRYRMEFDRDGRRPTIMVGLRDEEAEKNAKGDVESYIVRRNGRLYLAHTGGFRTGMHGTKVKFHEFADADNGEWEWISVDGDMTKMLESASQSASASNSMNRAAIIMLFIYDALVEKRDVSNDDVQKHLCERMNAQAHESRVSMKHVRFWRKRLAERLRVAASTLASVEQSAHEKQDVLAQRVLQDAVRTMLLTSSSNNFANADVRALTLKCYEEELAQAQAHANEQMILITPIEDIAPQGIVENIDRFMSLRLKFTDNANHNLILSPNKESEVDVDDFYSLAIKLRLEPKFLQEIWTLLEEKRQIIFQGPPGTGPTLPNSWRGT